jgi:serine protease Do
VLLAAGLVAIGAAAAEEQRSPEPSLVRVTIFKTTKSGTGETVNLGGKTLKNYHPTIIHVFRSSGVVVDDRNNVATFLGYGWVDILGGDLRVELAVGSEARDQKVPGKLVGVDQSTGVAVIRAQEGVRLPRTPLCVQCAIRDGATVVMPRLEEDGSAQLERARILGVGNAEAMPWGGWQLTVNRRLPSLGAPMLDTQHRVLGFVANQVASAPSGEQHTILFPISQILTSASKIIDTGADICTGWLGIYLDDATPAKVRVTKVTNDSPAFRAGLEPDDVVVKWNGNPVRDARQFIRLVQESRVGSKVELGVIRRSKPTTLTAQIGTRRPEAESGTFVMKFPELVTFADPSTARSGDPRSESRPRIGAEIVALTAQLAEFLEIPVQVGLLISSVEPRMPAALAGMQTGDVIVAVDGQRIADPAAFIAHVQSRAWGSAIVLRFLRKKSEHDARLYLRAPAETARKK